MTDYRDINHPGIHPSRTDAYNNVGRSSTSIGGILIALAVIGLVFLGMTLFFGGSGDKISAPPLTDSTIVKPETAPAPAIETPAPAPTE